MHLNENQLNQTTGINYSSVINDSEFKAGNLGNLDKLIEENSKLPSVKSTGKKVKKHIKLKYVEPELNELKKIFDNLVTPNNDINIINNELGTRVLNSVGNSKGKKKIVVNNGGKFPLKNKYTVNPELIELDKLETPNVIREIEILEGFFKWYIYRYRTTHYFQDDLLQDMKLSYIESRMKGECINYSKEKALFQSFDIWMQYTNKKFSRKRVNGKRENKLLEYDVRNFDTVYTGTPELLESAMKLNTTETNDFNSAKFLINFYRLILKSCKDTIDKKIIKLSLSGNSHSQIANELQIHRPTESRRFKAILERFHELNNINQKVN
jgi:hypothetical protein